ARCSAWMSCCATVFFGTNGISVAVQLYRSPPRHCRHSFAGAQKALYGADHLDPMTERLKLTRPVESARAGFDNHSAWIILRQDSEELITHDPTLQNDTAVPVGVGTRSWRYQCRGSRLS